MQQYPFAHDRRRQRRSQIQPVVKVALSADKHVRCDSGAAPSARRPERQPSGRRRRPARSSNAQHTRRGKAEWDSMRAQVAEQSRPGQDRQSKAARAFQTLGGLLVSN